MVQVFDDQGELLDLELLVLNLAIFVLDLAVGDVQVRLKLLKLGDANDVLTNLDYLELKFFIFNRLCAQIVTETFDFGLHRVDLGLLSLRLGLQFRLVLLQRIDLHQVFRHFLLEQLSHFFMHTFFMV